MTQSNLSLLNKAPKEMPFKELINQRAALTRTIPLLDDESKEIAKADMAAVAKECSPKWDDLYVTRENLKSIINIIDQQQNLEIKKARDKSLILVGFGGAFRRTGDWNWN